MAKKKPDQTPSAGDLAGTPFEDVVLPSTSVDDPKTSPEHMVGEDTEIEELSGLKDADQDGDKAAPAAEAPLFPGAIPPEMDLGDRTPPPGAPMAPSGFLDTRELTPATGSPTYPPHPIHPSQPNIPMYGYAPPPGPRRMSPTAAAVVLGVGSLILTGSGLYAWDAGLFSDKPKPAPVVAAAPPPAPEPEKEPELLAAQPAFAPDVGPVHFSIVEDSTASGLKGLERGLFEGAELGLKGGTLTKLSEAHGGGSFVGALWLKALEVKKDAGKSVVNTTCQMALTPEVGVEGTRKQVATTVFEAPAGEGDAAAVGYLAAQNCGSVLIAQLDKELSAPPPAAATADAGTKEADAVKKAEPKKVTKKKRRRRRKRRGKRRRRRRRRR